MYKPEKGDIVLIDFDPSAGKEIMKRRPAFVISRLAFNDHTGFAIVAPITSSIRNFKLEVVLNDLMKTTGAVLVHQLKALDFSERNVEFIEKTPQDITQKVTSLAKVIIS